LSSGAVTSDRYKKIQAIPTTITELLDATGFFNDVLRGYPEGMNTFKGGVASVYFNTMSFTETMQGRNKPEFVNSVIGITEKGSKTEVHDRIINNSLCILEKFGGLQDVPGDPDWITLTGNVRNTFIDFFQINPERYGKSMLTTSIIKLKHDVRW